MSDTIMTAVGVAVGALHRRLGRPGQDAALAVAHPDLAVVVLAVADGCGSARASEVGAQLGVRLWARAVERGLRAGLAPADPAMWAAARAAVVASLAGLADELAPDRERAIAEVLLFTSLVAVVGPGGGAVYTVGDGCYQAAAAPPVVLAAEADNCPAYLAYDLVGEPAVGHLTVMPPSPRGVVWLGTDGLSTLVATGCPELRALLACPRSAAHPDRLRRQLERWARGGDAPARLTDDAAIALARWGDAP
ncbi:MAG: protein phosphatase 2C domain-containing protein [Kofleriaceae bacterium]